eukprot:TRINITY_DN2257_c0_g1_i1.p1 TRINITY_DN2257_c0_g1~~TRINITY_DN2257_c0_g1_i1.p1  ORF type:complete len:275 (+),score=62.74 TRINITY_DN2257_c0_g1_i1:98-826(+)
MDVHLVRKEPIVAEEERKENASREGGKKTRRNPRSSEDVSKRTANEQLSKRSKGDESEEQDPSAEVTGKEKAVFPHYKIRWDQFLLPFDQLQSIEQGDLMDEDEERPNFVDESVPPEDLSASHAKLMQAIRRYDQWTVIEATHIPEEQSSEATCRFIWKCQNAYLMYISIPDEWMAMAIEDRTDDLSLIVGCEGGHPFIFTSEFAYGDSNGSTGAGLTGIPTPDTTLCEMARDLLHHGDHGF